MVHSSPRKAGQIVTMSRFMQIPVTKKQMMKTMKKTRTREMGPS